MLRNGLHQPAFRARKRYFILLDVIGQNCEYAFKRVKVRVLEEKAELPVD